MKRVIDRLRSWDIFIGNRLPARIVFIVLLRVYQDDLRQHGYGKTGDSLERAVNDWGKRAYPER
jgi:hypothetical protein